MAETKISDKAMQAAPGERDRWLIDPGARGAGRLVGRITPAGQRRFYYRYTDPDGNRVRMLIGAYDARGDGAATFTLKQARTRAVDLQVLHGSGKRDLREHFAEERTAAEKAKADAIAAAEAETRAAEDRATAVETERQRRKTVRQVFDQWRATELQPLVRADGKRIGRKDGGQYVLEQFTRHVFPAIGAVALEDVRKADLLALLDAQIAAGKARTANVLLADLKQMLDFALERELMATNPLATTKKSKVGGKDVERERVLTEDEVKQLSGALPQANLGPRSVCAIWLALAAGVRVGELMGAIWADALPTEPQARKASLDAMLALADAEDVKLGLVDLDACTWYLPTTKNQRDHAIHLSAFAVEQFKKLRELRVMLKDTDPAGESGKPSPWVFPATDAARPVCIKSFGKQLADRQRQPEQRLTNRSKAATALMLAGGKWTAHDLRRTAGTMMARLGFSTDTINECLNHISADRMARVYIRDRREADQARAFDALGAKLSELTATTTSAANACQRAAD
jgi:integrase